MWTCENQPRYITAESEQGGLFKSEAIFALPSSISGHGAGGGDAHSHGLIQGIHLKNSLPFP